MSTSVQKMYEKAIYEFFQTETLLAWIENAYFKAD